MARYGGALLKRIGLTIQKKRRALSLSQLETAHRAGMSSHYLSEIERGKRNLSVVMLDHIASALEIKLFELLKK